MKPQSAPLVTHLFQQDSSSFPDAGLSIQVPFKIATIKKANAGKDVGKEFLCTLCGSIKCAATMEMSVVFSLKIEI